MTDTGAETNLSDVAEPQEGADTEGVDASPGGDEIEPELDDDGNPVEGKLAGAEDETEEVEHEGKTYKVHKDLKPALMFNADYTRKTQEVAEARKALDARHQELTTREQSWQTLSTQHAEASDKLLETRAQGVAIDQQIAAYDALIKEAETAGDADRARDLKFYRQDLKDAKADLVGEISKQQAELTGLQQRAAHEANNARQADIAKGIAALEQDPAVKLTRPMFDAVASHLQDTYGIAPQELYGVSNDPRLFKVAKDLVDKSVRLEKAEAELKALKKGVTATSARPANTASGSNAGAGARKPSDASGDKLSSDAWHRRRLAEKAAKADADQKRRYG